MPGESEDRGCESLVVALGFLGDSFFKEEVLDMTAILSDDEVARLVLGSVEKAQFDFVRFTEDYGEYNEIPEGRMILFCEKCWDMIPLSGDLLLHFRERAGVPPDQVISWKQGMYFNLENCGSDQETVKLVETGHSFDF